MFIKVLPEQVEKGWDVVAPIIGRSLPPQLRVTRTAMVNILRAILTEEATVWVLKDGGEDPLAVCVTGTQVDTISGSKYLLVYAFTALVTLRVEHYLEALQVLRDYADDTGLSAILAYVENEAFLRILGQIGGQKLSNLVRL